MKIKSPQHYEYSFYNISLFLLDALFYIQNYQPMQNTSMHRIHRV